MWRNIVIISAAAILLIMGAAGAFGQQSETTPKADDSRRELKELLTWIKVLGTFKAPNQYRGDAVLLYSGCTIKQNYGNFEALFSLSNMDPDSVELSKGTFGNEEITVLHARDFAKVVTNTRHDISDDICKVSRVCDGTEYSDRALVWSNSPQGGLKMKKFLVRAIELCTP
jgi:hypothetical protein